MISKLDKTHQAKSVAAAKLAHDPRALADAMNLPQTGEDRERIISRLADMPKTMRRLFCRAYRGRSMKSAIRAHCLMCMGYQRGEVPLCASPECPLHQYRPL